MSIDLGAILDSVTPITTSVLETSGSIVDISRPSAPTVDQVTLQLSEPQTNIYSDLSALITAASISSRHDGPKRPRDLGFYLVKLPPDTVDVQIGDLVTATTSRDPALVDAALIVREVGFDGAGLFRILRCERRRPDGG